MKFWANCFAGREPRSRATRHEFVIGPLCKRKVFQQKARLYYCMRCKWSFLVCGSKVAVLDEDGSPLGDNESLRRLTTFEEGPCPVLEAFFSAASFNTGPPEPQFSKESHAEPGHLAPRHLHARSARRRPALQVVSRMVKI